MGLSYLLQLFLYRFLLYFFWLGTFLLRPLLSPKLRGILAEKSLFIDLKKAPAKALWFHAASGEFEYIKHILRLIKKQHPQTPIVVSYFSISYKKQIENFAEVDFSFMLPWDFPWNVKKVISQLEPKAFFVARTDIWPELLYQIHQQKIPAYLLAARQSSHSLQNLFFSPFDEIHCITELDQKYFQNMHLKNTKVFFTGDPRYDQVFYRLQNSASLNLQFPPGKPIFIAASLWPEDEKALLPAIQKYKKDFSWILVPHEPTQEHIQSLVEFCIQAQMSYQMYSQTQTWNSEVLIIDKMGILAQLYQQSDLAFIGGSFKKQVHSVMEALACGNICLVGPYYQNNSEAIEYSQMTSLHLDIRAVNIAHNAEELQSLIEKLKLHWDEIKITKDALVQSLKQKQGASERIIETVPLKCP